MKGRPRVLAVLGSALPYWRSRGYRYQCAVAAGDLGDTASGNYDGLLQLKETKERIVVAATDVAEQEQEF